MMVQPRGVKMALKIRMINKKVVKMIMQLL
jgi:hypothetical protein